MRIQKISRLDEFTTFRPGLSKRCSQRQSLIAHPLFGRDHAFRKPTFAHGSHLPRHGLLSGLYFAIVAYSPIIRLYCRRTTRDFEYLPYGRETRIVIDYGRRRVPIPRPCMPTRKRPNEGSNPRSIAIREPPVCLVNGVTDRLESAGQQSVNRAFKTSIGPDIAVFQFMGRPHRRAEAINKVVRVRGNP